MVSPTPRPLTIGARQVVAQLSRLLWQTEPDASLLAVADSGSLATSEDVRQLALRMQQDARSRIGVGSFYRWWLNLDALLIIRKDSALFPQFNPVLAQSMAKETEAFGVYLTLDTDGTFANLLTDPISFINEQLAAVYGISGVTGPELRLWPITPGGRGGVFSHPSFLTLTSHAAVGSPSRRGTVLSNTMLCRMIPPPPPDQSAVVAPPAQNEISTTRQRLARQTAAEPVCVTCHSQIDPLGFGFENFDAIGQYRTLDNGLPVDASGHIPGANVPYTGALQLATLLSNSAQAQSCMSQKWLEYAVGSPMRGSAEETAALAEVNALFAASGFKLGHLVAAVAQTDLFLTHQYVCTPGADHTCNDNPILSSLRGRCTALARCECFSTNNNPVTGRCY